MTIIDTLDDTILDREARGREARRLTPHLEKNAYSVVLHGGAVEDPATEHRCDEIRGQKHECAVLTKDK